MTAKSQSGVKQLGEQAQGILHRLLDEQVAPESIANILWLQTRESISPEAITRYASRYRRRQQEQEQLRQKLDGFIARAQQDGISISDLLRAFLVEKLSQARRDGTLKKVDFLDLETAERRRSEFELKQQQAKLSAAFRERELKVKERQARLAERRFQLDRAKAQAVLDRLTRKAGAGKRFSQDDMRQIHELYGLYTADPSPHDEDATRKQNDSA